MSEEINDENAPVRDLPSEESGGLSHEDFAGDKFYKFAKGRGVMNLPNKLTVSRMVMIPVFVLFFYLEFTGHFFVALAVFAIASLTDLFDGKIARTNTRARYQDLDASRVQRQVAAKYLRAWMRSITADSFG